MNGPYLDMAESLDIPMCEGVTKRGSYCRLGDHRVGFATENEIHFANRGRSMTSTYRFLKIAAQASDPTLNDGPPWRRVFRVDRRARELGADLHIRVPLRYWTDDKAFVLANVATRGNDVPDRKQAFDWARRPRRR